MGRFNRVNIVIKHNMMKLTALMIKRASVVQWFKHLTKQCDFRISCVHNLTFLLKENIVMQSALSEEIERKSTEPAWSTKA